MSIASKGISVFVSNWMLLPIKLVTSIVVIRLIGAEGKGYLVMITTGIGLLSSLGQFGLLNATTFFLRKNTYSERTLLCNYMIILIVYVFVSSMLISLFDDMFLQIFFDEFNNSTFLIKVIILTLPVLMMLTFIKNIMLAKEDTKHYRIITVGEAVLTLLLTIILTYFCDLHFEGALFAYIIAQALFMIWGCFIIIRSSRFQKIEISFLIMKELLKYGLSNYFIPISTLIFRRLDCFFIAYFMDIKYVGYYSVALLAYDLLLSIPSSINVLVLGFTSSSGKNRNTEIVIAQTVRHIFGIMLVLTIIGSTLSIFFIPLLYGQDFRVAIIPLIILSFSAILFGSTNIIQSFFLGIGKPLLIGSANVLGLFIKLILSLWLIPMYGIVGNAISVLIGMLLIFFFRVSLIKKYTTLSAYELFVLTRQDSKRIINKLKFAK